MAPADRRKRPLFSAFIVSPPLPQTSYDGKYVIKNDKFVDFCFLG
jgi:hypothetical protein